MRWKRKPNSWEKFRKWHEHFAWLPTPIYKDNKSSKAIYVWLETIERKRIDEWPHCSRYIHRFKK